MIVKDRIKEYLDNFVAERDRLTNLYQPYVDDPSCDTTGWERDKEWYNEVIEMLDNLTDAVNGF